VPSERCSIEEQSMEYCRGRVVSSDEVPAHHVTKHSRHLLGFHAYIN
jgi:hypothetical protein